MMDDRPAAERLKELRERSGLTVRAMAKALGMGESSSTYASRETTNKAKKQYVPAEHAHAYAQVLVGLGTPPITKDEVLALAGIPALPASPPAEALADDDDGKPRPGYFVLKEYDVAAAAGDGAFPRLSPGGEAGVLAEWRVPRALLPPQYQGGAIGIIRVQGDSMVPELMPEERVMVDLAQTFVGPEGIYLLVLDDSLLVKRVQKIGGGKLRLVSRNPDFEPLVVPINEVRVLGRVIARWEWK